VSSNATIPKRHRNSKRITSLAVACFLLLFVLSLLHPFGNAKVANPDKELMVSAQVEHSVLDVMQRGCQNCHSEQTVWPLYSRVAPISWLIEKDVQDGRSHWNMSTWEHYGIDEQEDILSRIGPMVRNRRMPLPQYLFLHPEAKLSDADIELLYQWSRRERKRLKSEASSESPGVE
jgi:cytochrome c